MFFREECLFPIPTVRNYVYPKFHCASLSELSELSPEATCKLFLRAVPWPEPKVKIIAAGLIIYKEKKEAVL